MFWGAFPQWHDKQGGTAGLWFVPVQAAQEHT